MSVIDLLRNIWERHNKPLKTLEMVVVHSDTDFHDDITGSLGMYVREELNVGDAVSCNDLLKYASLRAEPDYRNDRVMSWKKKPGKAMELVAKEVKSMTQAQILDFQKAGEGSFAGHRWIARHEEALTHLKVINDFKSPDGATQADINAAGDGEVLVVLDLRSDETLLEACFSWEIVNRTQNSKKFDSTKNSLSILLALFPAHENLTPQAQSRTDSCNAAGSREVKLGKCRYK
uniref:Uncharacterized protein n=1 Tax=Physcomitrium patens TaxID=3218 RepID=A0A2K1KJ09_PHYPA|nr:hypothetical protein PHYPA_007428 [Physcomitrium patens]